jgi:hypothetical protein
MTVTTNFPPSVEAARNAATAENRKATELWNKYGESIEPLKKAIKAAANGKGKWSDAWNKFNEAGKRLTALEAQIPVLEKAIDKLADEIKKHVAVADPKAEQLNNELAVLRLSPKIFKRATEFFVDST